MIDMSQIPIDKWIAVHCCQLIPQFEEPSKRGKVAVLCKLDDPIGLAMAKIDSLFAPAPEHDAWVFWWSKQETIDFMERTGRHDLATIVNPEECFQVYIVATGVNRVISIVRANNPLLDAASSVVEMLNPAAPSGTAYSMPISNGKPYVAPLGKQTDLLTGKHWANINPRSPRF